MPKTAAAAVFPKPLRTAPAAVFRPNGAFRAPACRNGHGLSITLCQFASQICDACGRHIRSTYSHRCGACDFDLCKRCFETAEPSADPAPPARAQKGMSGGVMRPDPDALVAGASDDEAESREMPHHAPPAVAAGAAAEGAGRGGSSAPPRQHRVWTPTPAMPAPQVRTPTPADERGTSALDADALEGSPQAGAAEQEAAAIVADNGSEAQLDAPELHSPPGTAGCEQRWQTGWRTASAPMQSGWRHSPLPTRPRSERQARRPAYSPVLIRPPMTGRPMLGRNLDAVYGHRPFPRRRDDMDNGMRRLDMPQYFAGQQQSPRIPPVDNLVAAERRRRESAGSEEDGADELHRRTPSDVYAVYASARGSVGNEKHTHVAPEAPQEGKTSLPAAEKFTLGLMGQVVASAAPRSSRKQSPRPHAVTAACSGAVFMWQPSDPMRLRQSEDTKLPGKWIC
eukprot:TRINITY_DN10559_c0_g1_i3.p1 TRINITY_DN10559_c0_g1~~TRINITY_DN10559_c0_g1_i3.p1  ORF type:complete len:454 (+),score=85.58 TRINITY_DN10559_c0_g1_i3:215-1576(+)